MANSILRIKSKYVIAPLCLTVLGLWSVDASAYTADLIYTTTYSIGSTADYGGVSANDFRVFGETTNITSAYGLNSISIATPDSGSLSQGNPSSTMTVNWSNGTPTASGSTTKYQYFTSGGPTTETFSYTPSFAVTTLRVLMAFDGTGATSSTAYSVKLGTGSTLTYNNTAINTVEFREFLFSVTGANVGTDTLDFVISSILGTNGAGSVTVSAGLMAAETVPEPPTIALMGIGALLAFRKRPAGKSAAV
jgi:hypothetical protein